MTDKEPPIHAEEGNVWYDAPEDGKEQVYLPKKDFPVYSSEIPENYIRTECAACKHEFWTWLNNALNNYVHCPKCRFPLTVNVKAIPDV